MIMANRKRYVKYWVCNECSTRQLRSDYCKGCGAPRTRSTPFFEPETEQELLEAEAVAEGNFDALMTDAVNSVFCSNCTRRLPSDARFCPGCGNQADSSDELPQATKGSVGGPVNLDITNHRRYQHRELDDTGYKSAGGNDGIGVDMKSAKVENPQFVSPLPPVYESSRNYSEKPDNSFIRFIQKWVREPGVWIATGVMLFTLMLVFIFFPRKVEATVGRFEYKSYIEISYIWVQTGSCWEGDCPTNYREVSSRVEDYYPGGESVVGQRTEVVQPWDSVQIGSDYDTDTINERVCADHGKEYDCTEEIDGVVDPKICTLEPPCEDIPVEITVEVPIMATVTPHVEMIDVYGTSTPYPRRNISYQLDVVDFEKIWMPSWVVGNEISFPTYDLNPDRRESFTGGKGSTQRVVFEINGKEQSLEVSLDNWLYLQNYEGETITVTTDFFGNVTGIVDPSK
jgi:hypothetical protein